MSDSSHSPETEDLRALLENADSYVLFLRRGEGIKVLLKGDHNTIIDALWSASASRNDSVSSPQSCREQSQQANR